MSSTLSSKKSSISSHPVVVGVLASKKASSRDLEAVLGSDFLFDKEYDPEDAARQLIAEQYGGAPLSPSNENVVDAEHSEHFGQSSKDVAAPVEAKSDDGFDWSEELDETPVEGSPVKHGNGHVGSSGTCDSVLRVTRGLARNRDREVDKKVDKKDNAGRDGNGKTADVSDGESSTAQDEPRHPDNDDYSDGSDTVVSTKGYSNDQKTMLAAVYELFETSCMNCNIIGKARMACSMHGCTNTVCRTCFRVNGWDWNAAICKNNWMCIRCRSKSEYDSLRIPIIATVTNSSMQPECLGPKRCRECLESGEVPRASQKQTGEDGWEFFCHLCKQKGEMMCCMRKKCTRVVCIKCFKKYGWDWEEAMKMAKWKCPHCNLDCPRCKANKERKKQRIEKFS